MGDETKEQNNSTNLEVSISFSSFTLPSKGNIYTCS